MAIALSETDHANMHQFLGFVLDAYSDGSASKSQAVAALAQALTAAATDNRGELLAWFRSDQYRAWLEEMRA